MPILSIGTIVFKEVLIENDNIKKNQIQFLMIRRNHTFGFMDFIRGKYSLYNRDFILNLFKEMTVYEREIIKEKDFDYLWNYLWNHRSIQSQYKQEERLSEEKFVALKSGILFQNTIYSIQTFIDECELDETKWLEQEWGFPKGRRNHYERDYDCALREFREETGYSTRSLKNVENIMPVEELFTGSNYKSYKNKYYILKMMEETPKVVEHFDKSEVSKMEWKTYDECMECIRPYNLEKKQLLTNIYNVLCKYKLTE
jgi:8-oxo-dGTP pyrophosphatase MutT (NUDIX family)